MRRLLILCILVIFAAITARAQTESLLHAFAGAPSDGTAPINGSLIMDSSGNLYGTTSVGGNGTGTDCSPGTGAYSGCGTVFELIPSGPGTYTEKILYNFNGTPDGLSPVGGLIMDKAGNLYGTTEYDGIPDSCHTKSLGSVFELSPNGSGGYTETILYSFGNFSGSCNLGGTFVDGNQPESTLIMDSSGNLYGTTYGGGYCAAGTVFELTNSSGTWAESQLWQFEAGPANAQPATCGTDAANPVGGLVMDANGDLLGTGTTGGANGKGAVFELVKTSTGYTEQMLYSFLGTSTDGGDPNAALIIDHFGDLIGTEAGNGGGGAVFELPYNPVAVPGTLPYSFKLLYNFTCLAGDGCAPEAPLIMDASGNLYGTTSAGGAAGFGSVFELVNSSGSYSEKVIYSFAGSATDGLDPLAGLFMDSSGNLYGITNGNGGTTVPGMGTVYELSSTTAGATITPSSLSFSSQVIGTTSAAQTVTVTSSGGANLIFGAGAATLSGTNAADFAISADACSSQSVAPGKTCTVSVTFKPSISGSESATLDLADNSDAGSPQTVPLSGTGADFSLGVATGYTSSATVTPGGTGNYYLSLTPLGGFNQTVSIACTGAPSGAACGLSTTSVTLNGSSASAVSVRVTTTAPSAMPPIPQSPSLPPGWLVLILVGVVTLSAAGVLALNRAPSVQGRFSPKRAIVTLVGILMAGALLASCGGSGKASNPGTPAGSYTLTVTGTSGGLSHSTTLTLTVQ